GSPRSMAFRIWVTSATMPSIRRGRTTRDRKHHRPSHPLPDVYGFAELVGEDQDRAEQSENQGYETRELHRRSSRKGSPPRVPKRIVGPWRGRNRRGPRPATGHVAVPYAFRSSPPFGRERGTCLPGRSGLVLLRFAVVVRERVAGRIHSESQGC